jgi:hypothetical protein
MKRVIVLMAMVLVFASPAFASFNYGTDTYSSIGNQLIVNSLGDQSTVSTFGSLGTNDWIPENAVKNYLSMEGYTTAIDYNPSITNPQFVSAYNQAVPAGYTKLTFAGKLGNPRATQDVYVKTEEYNRLNPEMQAQRILQESIERVDDVDRLGIDINNANDAREDGDEILQDNIDDEADTRETADNNLQNNINTVDQDSQDRDAQEVIDRINGDQDVQDNVDAEATTRANADNNLQNNINKTNNRIDETNKRVDKLEDTQYNVVGKVRVYDSRKIQVNTFVSYSTNRSTVESAGVEVTWKLGSSYEERRADALEARLNKLEGIQDAKVREASTEVYTTKTGMGMRGTF